MKRQSNNVFRKSFALGLAGVLLLVSFAWFIPANAQNNGDQPSGQGLEITPPLIRLEVDPGDTTVVEIGVRNITTIDVIASGEVNDFVARGETGEPRILLGDEEESPYPLARYISNVPDLRIAPTEQEVVRVPIFVPEDASPGAHMGVIRFSATAADRTDEGSQVSLSASIGTLVLLHVSGDAVYDLGIEQLAILQDQEVRSWFEKGPLTFLLRLRNAGNVFLQPGGTLTVTNLFGKEVALSQLEPPEDHASGESGTVQAIEFNPTQRYILPSSIRRFEEAVDKDFWFGRYTLTADLVYGPDDTRLRGSVDFWVIPYKIVAVALLLLLAVVFFTRKALKAYRQNVLKKFQQEQNAQGQPHRDNVYPQQGPGNPPS